MASVSPAAAAVTVSLTLPWCGPTLFTVGSKLYSTFIGYFAAVFNVPSKTVTITSATCPTSTSSSPLQIGIPMIVSLLFKNVSTITSTANALLNDAASPETVSASLLTSLSSWYIPTAADSSANLGQVAQVTSLLVGVAVGQAIGCYVNITATGTNSRSISTSLANFTAAFDSVAIQNGFTVTPLPPAFLCRNNTVSSTYTIISNKVADGTVSSPNQLSSSSIAGIVIGTLLLVLFTSIFIYCIIPPTLKARIKNARNPSSQQQESTVVVSALNNKQTPGVASSLSSVEDGKLISSSSPLSQEDSDSEDRLTFSVANPIAAINNIWGSPSPRSRAVVGNVAILTKTAATTTTSPASPSLISQLTTTIRGPSPLPGVVPSFTRRDEIEKDRRQGHDTFLSINPMFSEENNNPTVPTVGAAAMVYSASSSQRTGGVNRFIREAPINTNATTATTAPAILVTNPMGPPGSWPSESDEHRAKPPRKVRGSARHL